MNKCLRLDKRPFRRSKLNPLNQVFYLNQFMVFNNSGKLFYKLNPLNQVFYLNLAFHLETDSYVELLNPLNQVFYLNTIAHKSLHSIEINKCFRKVYKTFLNINHKQNLFLFVSLYFLIIQ